MRPWIDPSKPARDSARETTKKTFSVAEKKSKSTDKAIDDDLVVNLTEFMAFEGFWHRKSDEECIAQFNRRHAEQTGAHDVKWFEDGVAKVEKKIASKDIGRLRKSKGESTSHATVQLDTEASEFDAEVKRRRLTAKTSGPGSAFPSPPSSTVPSERPTAGRSSQH